MSTCARLWTVGVIMLALAAWFVTTSGNGTAADDPKGSVPIPDDDFKLLVTSSNKVIQEMLADKPDKRAAAKARTAAMYIAMYSQAGGPNGPNAAARAAVRDAALKVADDIKAGKFDDAKKGAEALANMKGNGKPGTVVELGKQIELDEVMMYFHRVKLGGTDLEFKLLNLSNDRAAKKNKALAAEQLNDDLVTMAYQVATTTDFVKDHDPKPKAKADWKKYAESARANAIDLAKAARDKKGPEAWTALNKLNASCTDCHNKYK